MKRLVVLIVSIFVFFPELLFSQKIEMFSMSSCDNKGRNIAFINERIVEYKHSSDTLTVVLDVVANCAIDPSPKIKFKKGILNIDLNNTSDIVEMCECCFELRFVITEVDSFNTAVIYLGEKILKFNENRLIPLPDEYVITDTTHFNQLNENGLKVGFWKEKLYDKKIERLTFYKVVDDKSVFMWSKVVDIETKQLKSVSIRMRDGENMELLPEEYEAIWKERVIIE